MSVYTRVACAAWPLRRDSAGVPQGAPIQDHPASPTEPQIVAPRGPRARDHNVGRAPIRSAEDADEDGCSSDGRQQRDDSSTASGRASRILPRTRIMRNACAARPDQSTSHERRWRVSGSAVVVPQQSAEEPLATDAAKLRRGVGGRFVRRSGGRFGERPVAESLVRPTGHLELGRFDWPDRREPRGSSSKEGVEPKGLSSKGRARREPCLCSIARQKFKDGVVPSS